MERVLFGITFLLAAPFWGLMILAPGWSWTRQIIGSPLIVLPVAAIYALLVVPGLGAVWAAFGNPDFDGVQAFLGSDLGTSAAWAHLVAYDLFVGRWMYLHSREHGVSPLVMAPVLVLTVLLSPLGLLAYFAIATLRPTRTAPEPTNV